ncbi:putative ABC transport system permease protein [Enhydrobacter aerosaccus]|uniref:Putative ABC transport system permease protein n=1 Tax=Enhydrobacter aerosaccus TaxID=225324 RepID=A0A1T4SPK9_9HYPH|nr:ABC transporter permease [Enhydrobacter aerosaccus]SKA30179.1 putative ABC transport system permease protein [Enhydrobacter aerosaccus]
MFRLALTMLINERGKYLGIIAALSFTALMMAQQPAIFLGMLSRATALIDDIPSVDLWVMDPNVQYSDDSKPLQDAQLYRVKGIAGVEWAVPFFSGSIQARLPDGNFRNCIFYGIDDATFIGGPAKMVEGRITDLRLSDGVIVDAVSARGVLAQTATGEQRAPLGVGSTMELNDLRASIVGLHGGAPNVQSQPIIYTTYNRVKFFKSSDRKLLSFILVKLQPGVDAAKVVHDIRRYTGLAAYTKAEFSAMSSNYFLFRTGIFLNFGTSALISFLIGGSIAAQTFYNFTLDHLRYFGVLKAMGASSRLLFAMIALQMLSAGAIGFGVGIGVVTFFGVVVQGNTIAFNLNYWIVGGAAFAILLLSLGTAVLSSRPVRRLEPAAVFRG